MIKYDIIVPTFNLADKTIKCFERIIKYTKDFRLIWIDNGSDLEPYNIVYDYIISSKIQYTCFRLPYNIGYTKATNVGLAIATAPWRVLMNNDVYVTNSWLDHMTKCADINNYDIIGPLTSSNAASYQSVANMKNRIRDNIPNWDNYNIDEYALKILNTMRNDNIHIKNGMIAFFCTAIRDTVIKRIGYLSEEFNDGFASDDIYSLIAIDYGFNIGIDLGVYVHHDHRSTFKSLYSQSEIANMQQKALEVFKNRKNNFR